MNNKDKILQYRFTRYIMVSLRNHKINYLKKRKRLKEREQLTDDFTKIESKFNYVDLYENLGLSFQLINEDLEKALSLLKAREIQILFLHLVEEYTLKEISEQLNINYKTIQTIYRRTIVKIRKEFRGKD